MKEDINALDEISKGACMGIDATFDVLEKTQDKDFKKVIEVQHNKYKKIKNKIDELYKKYNSIDTPHETSVMNKVMTKMGVNIKTFADNSNSKLAELLITGTNMGIIEGRKILNEKKISKEVRKLIDEYVQMQEDSLDILKQYL